MYKINQIPLANYGITPGKAPLSNIALEGFLDMPKRLGKTFHDWLDEEGIEPYVAADELFFGSRGIRFYGFITAESQEDTVLKLRALYDDFGRLTATVALNTPYGIFNCYLKDKIEAKYIGEGAASIVLSFEEPNVDYPNRILPEERTIQQYHIDFIPFSAFGAFIEQTEGQYDRPELKQANFTSYNTAGYQLTKVGPLKVKLTLWFQEANFIALRANIQRLHQLLGSVGTRTINIDNTERDSFAVDGFSVSQIRLLNNKAIARVRLELLMAFDGKPVITPWLLDFRNEGVRDSSGNFVREQVTEPFYLWDSLERKVFDKNLNPIKLNR